MKQLSSKTATHDILEISRVLSFILDLKDPYTADHSKVVRTVSVFLGNKLSVSKDSLANLNIGGYMHDIGKISIPDSILFKPGRLTEEEFEIIKKHTTFGAQFIDKFSDLNRFRDLVLYHHEKYNGAGYPAGLAANAIPLEAQLISLADVYHALYSKRCYKRPFTKQEIIEEFKRCRKIQFDPYLTDELLLALDKNEIDSLLNDAQTQDDFEDDLYDQMMDISINESSTPEGQLQQMIDALITALDTMNPPYASHCKNVTLTVTALVEKMELEQQEQQDIILASLLHDIGRMGQRPGEQQAASYEEEHALIGEKMLSNVTRFSSLLPIIRSHHESFDGKGLPDGLQGKDIPFGARIITIADTFDALIKRPDTILGRPLTKLEARNQLGRMAGTLLDPDLVSVFFECTQLFHQE